MKHVKSKHHRTVLIACPNCHIVSDNSRSIGTHLRTCEGEKPTKAFQCELCEFNSDSFNGLQVHFSIKHKAAYNRTLPTKRIFLWTDLELVSLAKSQVRVRTTEAKIRQPVPSQSVSTSYHRSNWQNSTEPTLLGHITNCQTRK